MIRGSRSVHQAEPSKTRLFGPQGSRKARKKTQKHAKKRKKAAKKQQICEILTTFCAKQTQFRQFIRVNSWLT